jgi:hypothetical protein
MNPMVKKLLPATVALVIIGAIATTLSFRGLPLETPPDVRANDLDSRTTLDLPFFGLFASWPTTFESSPVFARIPYHPGPPKKFIERIELVWKTNVATLEIQGPKTIDPSLDRVAWRKCYSAWIYCRGAKEKLKNSLHPKIVREGHLSWLRSVSQEEPEGIHGVSQDQKNRLDEYVLFDVNGTTTHILLRTSVTADGAQALDLFQQTLATLRTVPLRELKTSAAWAGTEVARVRLKELLKEKDATVRIHALAKAQLTLASRMSVQPTHVEGFFHFGGISHLLAVELLKLAAGTLPYQESFFNAAEPNLLAMQSYIRDFGARSREEKNIEILIQDLSTRKARSARSR